jgi:DNA-binding transcriptional LysR family regulator
MGIGLAILPDYVENLLIPNVTVRPINGHPRFDLVMASRKDNRSTVVETFRSLVQELVADEALKANSAQSQQVLAHI